MRLTAVGRPDGRWQEEVWGSQLWGSNYLPCRMAKPHGMSAWNSSKANTSVQLCPHFWLRPRFRPRFHPRTGQSQRFPGEKTRYLYRDNPRGFGAPKGQLAALSRAGLSLQQGYMHGAQAKGIWAQQAELRAEDPGKGFVPRAAPCTTLGPGTPRPDSDTGTSGCILTGEVQQMFPAK